MKYYSKSGVKTKSLLGAYFNDIKNVINNKFNRETISTDDFTDEFDDDYFDDEDDITSPYEGAKVVVDDNVVSVVDSDGTVIDSSHIDDVLTHPMDDSNLINTLNGNEDDDDNEVL